MNTTKYVQRLNYLYVGDSRWVLYLNEEETTIADQDLPFSLIHPVGPRWLTDDDLASDLPEECRMPDELRAKLIERQKSLPESIPGYSYTGDRIDGGTEIRASGVTDENRRAKFIAGMIRLRYSADDIEAILMNGNSTPEHAARFEECNRYREWVKQQVDEVLSRSI